MKTLVIVLLILFSASCTTVSNENLKLAIEYYNLAQIYTENNRDSSEIIPLYTKALEFYPAFDDAAYSLAILYIQSENYDAAESIIQTQIQSGLAGNSLLLSLQAYLLLVQSNFEAAEEMYLNLIESDNASYDILFNLGLIYLETDRVTEAIELFTQSYEAKADYIPAYEQLALISYEKMEYLDVILRLEEFTNTIFEYPKSALILAESFIQTESYAKLFPLLDSFTSNYEGGDKSEVSLSLPEDLSEDYHNILRRTARLLAEVAIDDEGAMEYYQLLSDKSLYTQSEWEDELQLLESIVGLDSTIELITSVIAEFEDANVGSENEESQTGDNTDAEKIDTNEEAVTNDAKEGQ